MINDNVHQLHVDLRPAEALGKLRIYLSAEVHRGRTQLYLDMNRIEEPLGR